MLCRPGWYPVNCSSSAHELTIRRFRSGRPLAPLRAQSLPISPPRTSFSSDFEYADMVPSQSPRSSISSSTSMAPSIASSATTYTYSTAPSTPISLISRPPPPRGQSELHSKMPHRSVFQGLPPEVYDCILQQLRVLHEDPASQSCQTCHLRDLCSLALSSRAWDKAVVKRMLVNAASHCTVQEHVANTLIGMIGYILWDMTRRNR